MKIHTYSQKAALYLLRLYPGVWRKRYADEVVAVLEERPATLRTIFNLGLGMLDAYMHSQWLTEKEFSMQQRLHDSQVTVFAAFFLFASAWLFYMLFLSSHWMGLWSSSFYPELAGVKSSLALQIMNICGLCAGLVTVIGAVVLIVMTIAQTLKNKQKRFTLLSAGWFLSIFPAFALFFFLVQFSGINQVQHVQATNILNYLSLLPLICWAFVGPASLVLGTRKTRLSPRFTRLALLPTTFITLCMSVSLGAMVYLVLGLLVNEPQLSIMGSSKLLVSLALWMALLTVLCYVSLWRGWQAWQMQRQLKPV
jgi:hypothetical protein